MKRYNSFIFDIDGTLLNTLPATNKCINDALQECGVDKEQTIEETLKIMSLPGVEMATAVAAEYEIKEKETYLSSYFKFLKIDQMEYANPFGGISELLEKLETANSIYTASNKIEDFAYQILKKKFPSISFKGIYGDRIGKYAPKPAPDMIHLLLKENNLNKEDVLYIGDSEIDVLTAINAGIDSILVTYGYGFYNDELLAKATYVVNSVAELHDLIQKVRK